MDKRKPKRTLILVERNMQVREKRTKILILGGGVGGLVAANMLSKKLGKRHEVMLVEKKTKYEFTPSYLWLMMGWREPLQITRSLSLLKKKGITYVNGEVLKSI